MELKWFVSKDEIKRVRDEYTKECRMFRGKDNSMQDALWTLYAVEKKSNLPGLVLNLVNKYTRDRISHKYEHKDKPNESDLSISRWVQTSPLVTYLTKNDKHKMNIISAAIKTFFARFNSKIMFNPIEKVQDLAEPYAKYIYDITRFINKLCICDKSDKPIVPFQIDLWIKSAQKIHLNNDEIENEYEESSDDESKHEYEPEDTISDRLQTNKINCIQHKLKADGNERVIQNLFEELRQKYSNVGDLVEFMREKRFVIVVERGIVDTRDKEYVTIDYDDVKEEIKQVNQTQLGDRLYLFIPNIANKIPMKYSNEKFIQLSCDSVLPCVIKNHNEIFMKNDKNAAINAQTASKDFFMISWHVKQTDEISCYQYQRGQISKFIPSDIRNVWPYLFDECSGLNSEFFNEQTNEENKVNFVKNTKMVDNIFENFCKIGSSQKKIK